MNLNYNIYIFYYNYNFYIDIRVVEKENTFIRLANRTLEGQKESDQPEKN